MTFAGSLQAASGTFATMHGGLLQNTAPGVNPTAAIRLDASVAMPSSATFKIDLAAVGSGAVLSHPGAELRADGTSHWRGNLTIDATKTLAFDSGTGPLATLSASNYGGLGTALRVTLSNDWLEFARLPAQPPFTVNDSSALRWDTDGGTGEMHFGVGDGTTGQVTLFGHLSVIHRVGFYGAAPVSRPVITGTHGTAAHAASIESALTALGLVSR